MEAWNWPQWTAAAMYAIALIVHASKNGEATNGKYNFALKLCSIALGAWILYMGGFWTP